MQPLPQLIPKGAPPPPSSALAQLAQLPQFAEPPTQTVKLGLNLLPADAIPEPAPAVAAAPASAGLGLATVGSAVALAFGIVLATPEATADENAVLERLRRQDELLQPADLLQPLELPVYPFKGGQEIGRAYRVHFSHYNPTNSPAFITQYTYIDVWGQVQGIRVKPLSNTQYSAEILCRGLINDVVKSLGWFQAGFASGTNKLGGVTAKIESIATIDGKADTGGNPLPLTQAINSAPGQVLSSPDPYKREIGDRPIPTSAPQPQLAPISTSQQSSLLDFAEPEPRLRIIPYLLPASLPAPDRSTDTAPEVNEYPKKAPEPAPKINPTSASAPSSLSTKATQNFAPNPITRAPELQPQVQPQTKVDPAPEKSPLESLKDQVGSLITALELGLVTLTQIANRTTPEAIKNAAADGVCQTLQPNGCMAPVASNAKKAADNSASNSGKLDQINAGLNAADLGVGTDTNLRVRNLEDKLGAYEYPLTVPEYLLEPNLDKPHIITNQLQFNVWLLKQIDALLGLWPVKIEREDEDGNKQTLKFENVAEAITELTGLLSKIAFDADTSVNVGVHATSEAIGARIAALQAGDYVKAIIDYLGFQTARESFDVAISCTPSATGADGKLQESELEDFLKPSTQKIIGIECKEQDDLQSMIKRILFSTEVARAALYKPLKPEQVLGNNSKITGDAIREHKVKEKRLMDKKWSEFKKQIETQTNLPFKVDIDEIDNSSDTTP